MEFLKELKKISIVTMIIALVMGLLFIIFPAQCIKYISLALGIALVAFGIVGIINYYRDKATPFILVLSIIVLITGIIICVKYKAIISIIVVLFGVFILATGLVNIATGIKALKTFHPSGWFTIMLSVVISIFGIIAITKSSQLTEAIVRFIGAALLVYVVLGIVSYFQVRSLAKEVDDKIRLNSEIETQAVIIDETDET